MRCLDGDRSRRSHQPARRAIRAPGSHPGLAPGGAPGPLHPATRAMRPWRPPPSPTACRSCGRTTACRALCGAEFHADLEVNGSELILRKGFRREIDSYSAFFENDKTTPYRPRVLSPGAWIRPPLPLRSRHRLLRWVFRSRCPARWVSGYPGGRRLPRNRRRRLTRRSMAADGDGGSRAHYVG